MRDTVRFLRAVIVVGAWWALAEYPLFADNAFVLAIILWFVGKGVLRMFSSSMSRLGARGWWLILQLIAWCALYWWWDTKDAVAKILLLWGVGTPLLFLGALWRLGHDRFPILQRGFVVLPRMLLLMLHAGWTVWYWFGGAGLIDVLVGAAVSSLEVAVPLYYGWRLAEPLPRKVHDARFGSREGFRTAGLSDER